MPTNHLRFLSSNKHKIREAKAILKPLGVNVIPITKKIEELQTQDTDHLVKDKAMKAFSHSGRPLFVEHTGLYLKHLNNFPGGLTQVFWDAIGADRFAELFGNTPDTSVIARTVVAYIDGRNIHLFKGDISGTIARKPRGKRDFQWDCVFIPVGRKKTFSELGPLKNEISMRRKALAEFATFLKNAKGNS